MEYISGEFFGYTSKSFKFEEKNAIVVIPKQSNGKLAVKTEYWNAFPDTEAELLRRGYHLCFIENDNRWGTDIDLDRKARFVEFIQHEFGLSDKCAPVGMSCGGLIAIKFSAKYPEKVACVYLDAPVVNYFSCPCGFGIGVALDNGNGVGEILNALKLDSISDLLCYREQPIDVLPNLINHKIPIILVAGGSDVTVPFCENGIMIERAYKDSGINFELHIKKDCGHHPHGLEDLNIVADFIDANYVC